MGKTVFFIVIISLDFLCAGCSKQDSSLSAKAGGPVKPDQVTTVKTDIRSIEDKLSQGELKEARKEYLDYFDTISDPRELAKIKDRIEELNIKILFSGIVDKDSILYKVKPGDTLGKIAKQYRTTVALIKKANGLKSDLIRVGDELKISTAKFSIVVDKSQNLLFLKKGDDVFKTYRVSTGKDNTTPVGEFQIITKLKNPVHFRRDIKAVVPSGSPDNVLGTRWLGLSIQGYGIHGNASSEDLGKQVTQGCIRMLNQDAEELFSIVPRKTKVVIVD